MLPYVNVSKRREWFITCFSFIIGEGVGGLSVEAMKDSVG